MTGLATPVDQGDVLLTIVFASTIVPAADRTVVGRTVALRTAADRTVVGRTVADCLAAGLRSAD